ncbi:MarR family winged helix-turn-helix transcriptional regulator [Corallococcus sp. BB11-1]|uniref:MarR family winged helix-turn-helix transcriptional regulator n=1 Tax=Corallococcus sp. BB11-1 TaxID=2996783 RepID=UPI00226F3012|nr:MarR family winged helix-turn-helix transcriptional regulator [Corallococcus sp. BB11-1]MCY1032489.1 MarR family winged helix-turn-helix transcriptional regulator [Corallococcus sp. BB11-1]
MGSHSNQAPPPAGVSGEVRAAMDGLRQLVRLLRVSARASERQVGISGAQLFVLQELAEAGPCSINTLAERTLTHQSSVSVVVTKLIEQGLVRRSRSPQDGRRVEVALEPRGRTLLRKAPPMAQARLISGLRGLEPSVRAGLVRGLEAWAHALGSDGNAAPLFFEEDEPSRPSRRRKQQEPPDEET